MGERRVARQAEPQRAEAIFQVGAALGAAVHGDAGGLVDHQHQGVAVEQAGFEIERATAVQGFSITLRQHRPLAPSPRPRLVL